MRALTSREKRILVYFGIFLVVLGWDCLRRRWSPAPASGFQTEHYVIESSATPEQTREIGQVTEVVYRGYADLAARLQLTIAPHPKLKMKLFKDRDEFRLCNRIRGWAEAFYRRPCCYQYYSADEVHPYHWMMHEATHQLNAEAACLSLPQWLDEGLACYVSTSRIIDGSLHLGRIDTNTYPVWWFDSMTLSGDLEADKGNTRIIPLRAILSGRGGPNIDRHFNLYYLHWWSFNPFPDGARFRRTPARPRAPDRSRRHPAGVRAAHRTDRRHREAMVRLPARTEATTGRPCHAKPKAEPHNPILLQLKPNRHKLRQVFSVDSAPPRASIVPGSSAPGLTL